MSARRIALLIALIVGYCMFVLALASTLMAQTVRYEYRAQPEGESKPLPIPCFVLDRFNPLCVETGDIFVQHAHQKLASDAWVDRTKNKKGERCCDSGKDCFSLAPERIEHVRGGVNITLDDGRKVFVRGEDIMPSEDGKWWLCYWGNQVKCVFSPYSGS